jgi:hypothetical protein
MITSDDDCPFDGVIPTRNRPAPMPVAQPESQSDLQRVCNTPIGSLSFKDFLALKCGRDRFSQIKLSELQSAVSEMDWIAVTSAFIDDEKSQATSLRWILRGLDADKAIRKVRTDIEVSDKAIAKWRK